MPAYHVHVPSTLVYYVEARDEEEARQCLQVALANNLPEGFEVCILADLTEQAPPDQWDVADPSDHGECGCDQCVGDYDHGWGEPNDDRR